MKSLRHVLLFAMCSVGGHALAQNVEPKFASQIDILVLEPERPLQTLLLPVDVYESLQRNDLGDLRVLDGDGRAVPHAIRTLRETQLSASAAIDVPHFPLQPRTDEQAQAQGAPWVIEAQTSASGAIVRVKQAAVKTAASLDTEPPTPRAYLVDVSAVDRAPEAVIVELLRATEADLLMDLQVEGSVDLTTWMWIGSGTLAHLQHDDRRIDRTRVELATFGGSAFRYLRVQPTQPSDDFVVERVRAVVPPEHQAATQLHHAVTARAAKARDTYVFDVPRALAIDDVALLLPQARTFVSAQLFGVFDVQDGREALWNGVAYRLGSDRQLSEPIALQGRHFSRLELVIDPKGGGMGAGLPDLDVRFTPQQLLFVAQGNGPFTLVFGSAQAEPAAFEASELIGNTEDLPIETTRLGNKTTRDGNAALKPAAKIRPALTTKTILLWSILIAAVLATAVMALHVFRER